MIKHKSSAKIERDYSFLNYINNMNLNKFINPLKSPLVPFNPPVKVSYYSYNNKEDKEENKEEYKELYKNDKNDKNDNIIKDIKNIKSIKLLIEDKEVIFYKINKQNLGHTSFYFTDIDNKYFMKIPVLYLDYDILKREVFFLKKLEKYDCFPKLVFYNDFLLVTEYIGEIIKKETIPKDILFQINNINNIFKNEKIIHSDIKVNEMLIKDDKLYIIDFGWSRYNNKWSCDNGFCANKKPSFDNKPDLQTMIDIVLFLMNS